MAKHCLYKLILILFAFNNAYANYNFYSKGYLGEKEFGQYSGPSFPDFKQDPYLGYFVNFDDKYYSQYIVRHIQPKLIFSQEFFHKTLPMGVYCPNFELDEHIDYIEYIYRLLSLSYMYELFNSYNDIAEQVDSLNNCKLNYSKIISSCSPQSSDMISFRKNALVFLSKYEDFRIKDSDLPYNISSLTKSAHNTKTDSFSKRFRFWCKERNCNGRNIQREMNAMCVSDKKIFKKICSEQDSIKGLSSIPFAYELLGYSNVINNFNDHGHALGCLRRYSQLLRYKEEKILFFKEIYPSIKIELEQKYGNRFKQGMLFIPGSLREFSEKGLKNIFEPKIKQVANIVEVAVVEQKKNKPKVVVTAKPKEEVIEPKVLLDNHTKKEIELSAFKTAIMALKQNSSDFADVEMLRFKYDYIFSAKTIQKLSAPVKTYMSRKSLKAMKKIDKLGTTRGPVPLLFLKYLIDTENHQGLYNLVFVIGDKFFIKNNMDKKDNSNYLINLKNDLSTNYNWQISLVRN